MQTKQNHQKLLVQILQRLVNFLSKTPGRDQSCRFIQYFFMYLANTIKDENLRTKLLTVGGQMNTTRKILRFGRPIGVSLSIINNIKSFTSTRQLDPFNKNHNIYFVLNNVISNLFTNIYFITDHVLWLCNIGVIKNPELKSRVDYLSDFYWIWESVFGAIASAIEIFLLNAKLMQIRQNKSDDDICNQIQKTQREIRAAWKDFIKVFLNIPMAYGFVTGKINRQKIGALGTITSIIGCHQVWIQ